MTDSLLSRLSALTEPSRKIDAEIFERLGKIDEQHCRDWCSMDGRTDLTRKHFIKAWAPIYTASIDAAASLVQEDHWWTCGHCKRENHAACGPEDRRPQPYDGFDGFGATPAIALLIAILKAKEEAKLP